MTLHKNLRNLCVILVIILFSDTILAKSKIVGNIKIENDTVNFGEVLVGTTIPISFDLTNVGNTSIPIKVVPSCESCTKILESTFIIEVGKTSKLNVKLETFELTGPSERTLSLYVGNTMKRIILRMKGEVFSPIKINPSYIYFPKSNNKDLSQTLSVFIQNESNMELILDGVLSENKIFSPKLVRINDKYELFVKTVPPLNYGKNEGYISFKTNYPKLPVYKIKAFSNIQPPIYFTPSKIYIREGIHPIPVRKYFKLSFENLQNPINILETKLSARGLILETLEKTNKYISYAIYFPEGYKVSNSYDEQLKITTNIPDFNNIVLDIKGLDGF